MKALALSLSPLIAVGSAAAATVSVSSYNYLSSPNSSYPDSTGSELTDGVDQTIAWSSGATITASDVRPLVGWLNRNPSVQFNFGSFQLIDSVTVWIADSDNAAGVGLPNSVTVRTPDNSLSRTFTIDMPIDPTVSGTTVPIILDQLAFTTDTLIVEASRNSQWTMFSEVQFSDTSAVPEPSTSILLTGLLGSVLLFRRRG